MDREHSPVLIGYVSKIFERTVSGWTYDSSSPLRPLDVDIYINGAFSGRARADVFRQDLAQLNFGDGLHGFLFPIPDSIGTVQHVEVFFADTGAKLSSPEEDLIDLRSNRRLPPEWRVSDSHHALPSFFILGAAKSGTTSLHHYLGQCAGICMSDPKEPYYFEDEWECGSTFYFNKYFSHWRGELVVGEARHRNLYLPWVPERIHAHNPAARLIVILRDPVQRAVSHWWHWFNNSGLRSEQLPLEQALAANLRSMEHWAQLTVHEQQRGYATVLASDRDGPYRIPRNEGTLRTYIDSGFYMNQIERYLHLFGRECLHVVLLDDLIAEPQQAMAAILHFLGLDPAEATRINYSVHNQSITGVSQHVNRETLAMLAEIYAPHNARLERFLGRSLDSWTHPPAVRPHFAPVQACTNAAST